MGKSSKAPPVILRWQELGELPEYEVIIKAPEDDVPLVGKVKGKEKEDKEGKGKAEGPPLANYVILS